MEMGTPSREFSGLAQMSTYLSVVVITKTKRQDL